MSHRYETKWKKLIEMLTEHSIGWAVPTPTKEKNMDEVYTVGHVREQMEALLGVNNQVWLYHKARCPQPDVDLSGWPFYSKRQVEIVKLYFSQLTAVKRFLKRKAAAETQTA
jgi:hypothetical protein